MGADATDSATTQLSSDPNLAATAPEPIVPSPNQPITRASAAEAAAPVFGGVTDPSAGLAEELSQGEPTPLELSGAFFLSQSPTFAQRPKPPLNVILSEVDGSVQVIASSPALDANAAARLRRLSADTAAEFGKRVQSITLNGRSIDQESPASRGPFQ